MTESGWLLAKIWELKKNLKKLLYWFSNSCNYLELSELAPKITVHISDQEKPLSSGNRA
jgi:hypothetical protein